MDYSKLKIPYHVAIIVDGNGRWGKERNLSRSAGHSAGYENLKSLCIYMFERGVCCVSAYLFSTENFKRSKLEINYIMNLFIEKFDDFLALFHKGKIRAVFSGRKDNLPEKIIEVMNKIEEATKEYEGKTLNLCFGYGARAEIVDGIKKIIDDVESKKIKKDDINEDLFDKYMYQNLKPIDLLIRTGGELRLSNFMLWQASYAELYFTKTYFPDFDAKEFDKAILEYTKRDRRFGGINYENESN